MKDGAILANTGHFNVEIEIPALRRARVADARVAPERRGVRAGGRPPRLPARRRPPREPRGGRRPSRVRDGHELCEPGPLGRVRGRARGASSSRGSTACPRRSIARSPASSSRAWAPRSTASPRSRRSTWRPGTKGTYPVSLTPEEIVRLEDDRVVLLDQRRLPDEEVELECRSAAEVAEAIRTLAVRGAPAIGVAAAYGYALAAARGEDLDEAAATLLASRPTAVNLPWAIAEMRRRRPTPAALAERARATPRRRGRALPAHGGPCGRPARPGHAGAHPLQRRRARHGRRTARRSAPSARAFERGLVEHMSSSTRRGRSSRARG